MFACLSIWLQNYEVVTDVLDKFHHHLESLFVFRSVINWLIDSDLSTNVSWIFNQTFKSCT